MITFWVIKVKTDMRIIYVKGIKSMCKNESNKQPETAAIINLGCKVNKYEADAMKDKLIAAGMVVVEPEDAADIYIVNTCSVTNMAQKKSRQMLRRAKKRNPEAIVIAAGCYVNAEHDVLKGEDFVDIVVGNNCKKDIVDVIREYIDGRAGEDCYVEIGKTGEYEEMGSLSAAHLDHQRAYIKIQDGCNQFCSYCIIPYTRGRVRSRQPEHILEEIRNLARTGVKEFVLTGIHISSYGVDFKGNNMQYDSVMEEQEMTEAGNHTSGEKSADERTENLACMDLGRLVEQIADIPEVERIRLGSLEPRIVTEEFLSRITKSNKICPHFHLSLQSACNATLKRMNRKYTIEEFAEKCRLLRQCFDRPAITTDVIVGFPGETEEEFAVTVEHLRQLQLYEIHVFKYSPRSGTVAERMPDQIPEEKKHERSEVLLELTSRQKAAYERSLAGMEDEVLIEESVDDSQEEFTGHTKRYVKVSVHAKDDLVNRIVKYVY